MKKNQYIANTTRQQKMMQVLTKLEQTSDERNQETSNLQLQIIRLVLLTCKRGPHSSVMWCVITRWLVSNVMRQCGGLIFKSQKVMNNSRVEICSQEMNASHPFL
jgi:hypothetical protein